MPPQEARAWWADVEHLREDLERRRARREGRTIQPLRLVEGGGQGAPDRRGPREPLRVAPEPPASRRRPTPADPDSRERRPSGRSTVPAPRRRGELAREAAPGGPDRRPHDRGATEEAGDRGATREPGLRHGEGGRSTPEPGRFTPSPDGDVVPRAPREPGPGPGELLKARLDAAIAAVREPLVTREQRLATARSPREQRRSEPPLHKAPVDSQTGEEPDSAGDLRQAARRAAREAFADWSIAEPPAPGERRTIQIRGRQDDPPRLAPAGTRGDPIVRRPVPSARDRIDHRPDRIAAWAVALGFLLILMAAATANAAVLPVP